MRQHCASILRIRRSLPVAALLTLTVMPVLARAELVIEPVFNRGPLDAPKAVGIRQAVNGIQASLNLQPTWTALPNEVFSYVTGDPRNPGLDDLYFINDTNYNLNGFSLAIIGTGVDTDDPRTIVRGAPIDARFGDVDGDGKILSDIFPSYVISPDGKQIDFTGGLIEPGQRFTDIHLATSASPPTMAGIDSWFSGRISDSVLCASQGDPAAAAPFLLKDAYCLAPHSSIGEPGQPASVLAAGQFPANKDGTLDVFVVWEPNEIDVEPGESLTYSSELTWTSSHPNAVVKEWVGNFKNAPVSYLLTDTTNASPVELTKTDKSVKISNRTFDDSQFPGPIGRYHIQISGLEPGELVTFHKTASGGHIVPEPASGLLTLLASVSLLLRRRSFRW